MKKAKKSVSLFLALMLTLSLIPASVLSAAAADAYQILFEPQLSGSVLNSAYGDTAAAVSVADGVYRLVRFTGTGLENIPNATVDYPSIGAEYIAGENSDGKMGVINKKGETVVDFVYDFIERPDDSGLTKAYKRTGDSIAYYSLDLKAGTSAEITVEEFTADKTGGILSRYNSETEKFDFVDANGTVVLGGYDYASDFSNGYAVVYNTWDGGASLIDEAGAVIIPEGRYDWISGVSPDGLVWGINDEGAKAAILKVGGGPVAPVPPETAEAIPTNDTLKVNGTVQNATVYKIDDSNYFKIRDLAAVLNGTSKQFEVGYDGESKSVTATTGQAYTMAGGELAGAATANQTATVSNDTILVNGVKAENVTVYKIDGSNYFKLRDLGAALGFDVGWSAEEGMFINTEG